MAKALEHNAKCLDDAHLSPKQRPTTLLQRAEILLRLGQNAECIRTLGQLPAEQRQSPEALDLAGGSDAPRGAGAAPRAGRRTANPRPGRSTTRRCNCSAGRKRPATPGERRACAVQGGVSARRLPDGDRRRQRGPPRVLPGADDGLSRVRRSWRPTWTRRSCAGGWAVPTNRWPHTAGPWRRPTTGSTTPIPTSPGSNCGDARSTRISSTSTRRTFAGVRPWSSRSPPAIPLDESLRLAADTDRAWARDLLAQAQRLPAAKAGPLDRQARALLCQAGLAMQRIGPAPLRRSLLPRRPLGRATALLDGHDYRAAAETFQRYLRQELRRRNPQAWTGLGEALLAMDRTDEALAALDNCIDFYPRDAATFRARLLAARACVLKQDAARAERPPPREPRRRAAHAGQHRMARFALRPGGFALSYRALRRGHPPAGRSGPAVSRRRRRRWTPATRWPTPTASRPRRNRPSSTRTPPNRRGPPGPAASAASCRPRWRASDRPRPCSTRSPDAGPSSPAEAALLRNCRFQIGSLLVDLGQYQAAIKTYTQITSRAPTPPSRWTPTSRSPGRIARSTTRPRPARRSSRASGARADEAGRGVPGDDQSKPPRMGDGVETVNSTFGRRTGAVAKQPFSRRTRAARNRTG